VSDGLTTAPAQRTIPRRSISLLVRKEIVNRVIEVVTKRTVHTVNGWDSILSTLKLGRDYSSPECMFLELNRLLTETEAILASKGISYAALRTALVPQLHRREMALMFDTLDLRQSCGSYGSLIHTAVIPLFSKESNHTVLEGDYVDIWDGRQNLLFDMFKEGLVCAKDIVYRHSRQFYIIYINNLTDRMVETFHTHLSTFAPYVGYVDTTFSSRFKTYLSFILPQAYIKHRKIIIMGHEEDGDDNDDVNILGYPFEDFGFTIRSLRDTPYDVLLSYKIERPVFTGFEYDTEFSLNTVSPTPLSLTECLIEIGERKFGYLAREKTESLRRIGLLRGDDPCKLQTMIAERIQSNYIYNLSYDTEYDTTQFNIMLEIIARESSVPFRVLASLKYLPHEKRLSLITLF
jgi:hypothetical protein